MKKDVKLFIQKMLLLDEVYTSYSHTRLYDHLNKNIDLVDYNILDTFISHQLPQMIEELDAYKFYSNLSEEYFSSLIRNVYILSIISVVLFMVEVPLFIAFSFPVIYAIVCIILNCVVTMRYYGKIKEELIQSYEGIFNQLDLPYIDFRNKSKFFGKNKK